jgi:hypothetical protein
MPIYIISSIIIAFCLTAYAKEDYKWAENNNKLTFFLFVLSWPVIIIIGGIFSLWLVLNRK